MVPRYRLLFIGRFVLYELLEYFEMANLPGLGMLFAMQIVLSGEMWKHQPIQQLCFVSSVVLFACAWRCICRLVRLDIA